MKKILLTLVLGTFIGGVFAQDAKEQKEEVQEKVAVTEEEPTFKFITESHDFAVVTEGEQAIHEFKFYNTGKKPLILTNVSASCGCTTPIWPKEPIKPGEMGTIKAVYNSKGRPGPFTKSITVTSNATESVKVLKIKGTVKRPEPGTPVNNQKSPVINGNN